MRILAVDDDPIFREILGTSLAEVGYMNVEMASSADEALALILSETDPFECFLLDIEMPNRDGVELCRLIRRIQAHKTTPVIMITSIAEKSQIDHAFSVGATDYINKPIDVSEIRARLGTVESLVNQTRHANFLSQKLNGATPDAELQFSFDEVVFLEEVRGIISYLALENYLLKLGNMRMFANSLVGIHIANASDIFSRLVPQDFLDVMSTVADIVWRNIDGRVLFAYAGSGDFVAVVRREINLDSTVVEETIQADLNAAEDCWRVFDCQTPIVKVGKPVSNNLFSFRSSSQSMEYAISLARSSEKTGRVSSWFGAGAQ